MMIDFGEASRSGRRGVCEYHCFALQKVAESPAGQTPRYFPTSPSRPIVFVRTWTGSEEVTANHS